MPEYLVEKKKFNPKITSMLAKYARKENATDKILRNHLEVKWCLLKCISGCKFLENLLVDKTFVKLSRRRFMSSVWLKRNLNNTRQITMCSYFCKVTWSSVQQKRPLKSGQNKQLTSLTIITIDCTLIHNNFVN
jgi:hypothetical protein